MQDHSLSPVGQDMLKGLSKQQVCTLTLGEQSIRQQMQAELDSIKLQYAELQDTVLEIQGKFVRLKAKLFSPSSEKSKAKQSSQNNGSNSAKKKRTDFTKLPSERYPNAPIIEKELTLEKPPQCKHCNSKMIDSGLSEVSEYLTVEPRRYVITRQIRHKYRCGCCQGSVVTTPPAPRIKPGSAYSDELIIDVSMSKYCNLIPIERYAAMARREGFEGLPPNSLIEATYHLADFLAPVRQKIKEELLAARVLSADETPHKMLEGDKKTKNWYLWGFSSNTAAYFDCRNTRSGDIASSFLDKSRAEVLMSDVFSGYGKAVRIVNNLREKKSEVLLQSAYCNAHARRKFKEAEENFKDQAAFYIRCYKIVYKLEAWGEKSGKKMKNRGRMPGIFKKMLTQCQKDLKTVSEKSELARAIKYFTKNYDDFTLFIRDRDIPIDNNSQERLLRNPVVGRKTWYGTHSKLGVKTAATLFTITESCKINLLNPREYIQHVVKQIHQGRDPTAPADFKKLNQKIPDEPD